jgi:hypothetical protein
MRTIAAGFAVLLLLQVPAPHAVTVQTADDLYRALASARGGQTILLQAGTTYVGNFVLPARSESDTAVITIRTDVARLPEGRRITPAAARSLARIQSPNAQPALATAAGTHNWTIELVEFGPNANGIGDIITLGDSSERSIAQVPSQLTLDRIYVHGDPVAGQKRGIALNSASTKIINSYISDIKTIGQDSQAIAGWNGPGGYLIQNNFLEAAGENVMFGGGDPAIIGLTPTDITVKNNTMSKPLAWRDPDAPKWQIKNLFELKNAASVVIENNIFERNWPQAQSGYAILFTVRNQDGGCGWCQVRDVQFRNNIVRDVAAGFQILGIDPIAPSRQTTHVVISNNVFDGIDKAKWGGDGYFLQITDNARDITIDHNTIIQGESSGLVKVASVTDAFTFTNNIGSHGDFGIIGADHGVGNDSIRTYFPGAQITANVIAAGREAAYPPGNFFPSMDSFRAQFVNFDHHVYRLNAGSAWLHAGQNGTALGADFSALPQVAVPRSR